MSGFSPLGPMHAFENLGFKEVTKNPLWEEVPCLATSRGQQHILPLALVFLWVYYYCGHKQFSLLLVVCLKFKHLRVWFDLDQTSQGTKYISTLLHASMTPSGLWSSVNTSSGTHKHPTEPDVFVADEPQPYNTWPLICVMCSAPTIFFSLSVPLIQWEIWF